MTVILKNMMLTGAMTVIATGSSAQLVIALLIVLINLLFVFKLGPFVHDADDYLSFLTSCQMFFLIMTDDPNTPTYDSNFMGTTLVVVNGFGFAAFVLSLMALHPKCRKKLNKKGKNEDNAAAKKNMTRVVPE